MNEYLDINYKQAGDVTLYIDLFVPEGGSAPPPLVMWIHGGAWMYGDRKTPIMKWQTERGYALASIEYRLTGQGIFPDNITDCKDALIFLKQNAAKYGYDGSRIAVCGDSAGGHLAALMGTSAGHADWEPEGADCSVQAVVDYYGPTTVGKEWESASDPESFESKMLGSFVLSKQGRARAAAANPITYIDGTEPPFLILHGDKDDVVPYKQSIYLRDALEAAGSHVTMYRVTNGGHGFDSPVANMIIDEFLDINLMR